MSLRTHLEELAHDTWERLRDARALEIRFGEETITDLVLLELKRKHSPRSYIAQTPALKEKHQGTDWEWWVGSDRIGWIRYAIQAKRLDKDMRYGAITHKVKGASQIDLLEMYAKRNRAIPLYCLYNYASIGIDSTAWNCSFPYKQEQLACTVTSLEVAKVAVAKRGKKSFAVVHTDSSSIPWRCLIACPNIRQCYRIKNSVSMGQRHPLYDGEFYLHESLPQELRRARDSGRVDQFTTDFYDPEVGRPKRILVLETEQDDEGDS